MHIYIFHHCTTQILKKQYGLQLFTLDFSKKYEEHRNLCVLHILSQNLLIYKKSTDFKITCSVRRGTCQLYFHRMFSLFESGGNRILTRIRIRGAGIYNHGIFSIHGTGDNTSVGTDSVADAKIRALKIKLKA